MCMPKNHVFAYMPTCENMIESVFVYVYVSVLVIFKWLNICLYENAGADLDRCV